MDTDLTPYLNNWPYNPDDNLKHIIDENGSEKIQIRIEQGPFSGILQMELDGRPDGARPHGYDFALEYYEDKQIIYEKNNRFDFKLTHEECEELFEESRKLYERYAFLLQTSDYQRVIRDTEQNMLLLRFVNRFAESESDQNYLERWWPYIHRINISAKALYEVSQGAFPNALKIVRDGIQFFQNMKDRDFDEYRQEKKRAVKLLRDLEADIDQQREPGIIEKINKDLQKAIHDENYEKAAMLRDKLIELRGQNAAADH